MDTFHAVDVKENVNLSLDNNLCNMDLLLEKHTQLKQLKKKKKKELKFQQELWITQGLQIPIKKKDTLFS